MRSLRIQGLVRLADSVRRQISHPMSPEQKAALRRWVAVNLDRVEGILLDHGTRIDALPAPTRRAYAYLKAVDFDAPPSPMADARPPREHARVSFAGLARHWEAVVHALADVRASARTDALHAAIVRSSRNLEKHIDAGELAPAQLSPLTRDIRGWLAFFSQRANFDGYQAAVNRARRAFEAVLPATGRFRPPVWPCFKPIAAIYRLRGFPDGTCVNLPAPMITFSDDLFARVAAMQHDDPGAKAQVLSAMLSDEYQAVQADLEALGGVDEHPAGVHHDLSASFSRVNAKYFDGAMVRPRLAWSKVFTGRRFGHYDRIRDTVMISCTLDRADVPDHILDFVVYHELLHKKLGAEHRNGRMTIHTPQFRAEERRFEHLAEVEPAIRKLAPRNSNALQLGPEPRLA